MMAFSGVTSQCEERSFRRSAGTNFEIAIAVPVHALPVDDLFAKGRVREDGRLRHDFFLAEVKAPSESIAPWDYYKIRRIIPAQEAAQPLAQSKCAPIGDHFRQKRLVAGALEPDERLAVDDRCNFYNKPGRDQARAAKVAQSLVV